MADKLQGGIKSGSVSVSVPVILRKTSDNTENTGTLAAGVTAYYWRQGGTPTALTAASDLAAITTAFAAGGWKAADATNEPGVYRLDVDNAAFASGADWVIISVKVASCYVFYAHYALTTHVVQSGDSFPSVNTGVAPGTTNTGLVVGSQLAAVPTNFASMAISAAGRVAVQSGLTINQSLNNFDFPMVLATDHITPATGKTVTAQRSINGGAYGACSNAVTEISNGTYTINLSATDMNGATIKLLFTASGCDPTEFSLVTTP